MTGKAADRLRSAFGTSEDFSFSVWDSTADELARNSAAEFFYVAVGIRSASGGAINAQPCRIGRGAMPTATPEARSEYREVVGGQSLIRSRWAWAT